MGHEYTNGRRTAPVIVNRELPFEVFLAFSTRSAVNLSRCTIRIPLVFTLLFCYTESRKAVREIRSLKSVQIPTGGDYAPKTSVRPIACKAARPLSLHDLGGVFVLTPRRSESMPGRSGTAHGKLTARLKRCSRRTLGRERRGSKHISWTPACCCRCALLYRRARQVLKLGEAASSPVGRANRLSESDSVKDPRKSPSSSGRIALPQDRAKVRNGPVPEPSTQAQALAVITYAPDAAIVAEALAVQADYLVSLDRQHLVGVPHADLLPFLIGTPGDFLTWLRGRL